MHSVGLPHAFINANVLLVFLSLSSKEDQLHDMECLLVLAKAEGLRMVEEQVH